MINDSILEGVTKIANAKCKKRYPDFQVTDSHTQVILEAYLELLYKMIEEGDATSKRKATGKGNTTSGMVSKTVG
jgi:hypothetical protein